MAGEQDLLRERALGRGLACPLIERGLEVSRDLELVQGRSGLDLAQLTGLDNLVQCLEIALTTALGSDVFNVQFGFDGVNALVEETNPILARERVRVSIIQVLQSDPRVRRIVDLKLLDGRLTTSSGGAAVEDETLEQAIDRWRTLRVDVAFEVVTGDQAVVNLGKAVTNG